MIEYTINIPELCKWGRLYKCRYNDKGELVCPACSTGLGLEDLKRLWGTPMPEYIKGTKEQSIWSRVMGWFRRRRERKDERFKELVAEVNKSLVAKIDHLEKRHKDLEKQCDDKLDSYRVSIDALIRIRNENVEDYALVSARDGFYYVRRTSELHHLGFRHFYTYANEWKELWIKPRTPGKAARKAAVKKKAKR